MLSVLFAVAVLSAETSHPSNSLYSAGSPVEVTFTALGLAAGERRKLEVSVTDERDRKVGSFEDSIVADGSGTWQKTYRMPAERLGFYRVRAKAGDMELPKVGSRPKGTLTYAVVHDPATRPFVAEEDSFFGMFGNPHGGGDLMPWLGTHQQINGGNPAVDEAEYARESARRERFPVYGVIGAARLQWDVVPHLPDPKMRKKFKGQWPWDLVDTPDGVTLYRAALTALAKDAVKRPWPHSKRRIYEIFWEPDLTMKSPEHLVKTAQIAYETIHAADPEALVAAPTFAGTGTGVLLRRCLDAGLGKFMDVLSIHPYTAYPPETADFAKRLRAMRAMVREAKGSDVPMVATESGWSIAGHPDRELKQLNGQVACHLTTLGEGFLFHNPFHGYDCSTKNNPDGDYGLSHNLLYPKVVWHTTKVSPRPVSPGLAAASWLLDGKRPTCTIEWLSATAKGYAYSDRDDNCVIAMWDWTDSGEEVTLPVGRDEVDVADVMGNVTRHKTAKGELTLALSASAQYILAPDPRIWGREAQKRLNWSARKFVSEEDVAPLAVASVTASCGGGTFAVRTELENKTDAEVKGVVETRLRGVPGSGSRRSFTLRPRGTAAGRSVLSATFLPRPFDMYSVETRVLVNGKRVAEKETQLNFLAAERIDVKPGENPFAAWRSMKHIPLDMPVTRRPEFHHGPRDQSATAAFGWCDEYLLLDIVVQDDVFLQPTNGVSTWAGDSVQVALANRGLERESGNGYADVVAEAKTETTFAMTPAGPEAYRTGTWDWKNLPVGHHGEGRIPRDTLPYDVMLVTNESVGVTIHYQIAAPWKWMHVERPRVGTDIRFALSIGDLDPDVSIISAIEVFVLKVPRKFGHLVLVDGPCKVVAASAGTGAVEVAVIGQSQPPGEEPVPWTGCAWVSEDGAGNVYMPEGWMVRAGTTEAVKGARPCDAIPPNTDPAKCRPPMSCTAGWVAEWESFSLDRKAQVVRGVRRDNGEERVVFAYGKMLEQSAKVASVGVLAETGDLLLGTTYPDDKVYRFSPDGKEVRNVLWPTSAAAERFGYADGRTWALSSGAVSLETRPGVKRTEIGRGEHQVLAIVGSAKRGYWLATTQGALFFDPAELRHAARRVGGIGAATALGLNGDGRLVIASGYRAFGAWLGDFPDDRLDCNLLSWLIGARWSGCTTAIDVDEKGVFYMHDTKDGKKWGFDPRITAWTQRHQRRFPADERDIVGMVEDPAWGLPAGAKAVARCGEHVAAWYPEAKAVKIFRLNASR